MSKIIEKQCKGPCKLVKSINEFSVQKKNLSGYRSRCKACTSKDAAKYYNSNKEAFAIAAVKYRLNNKELFAIRGANYRANNSETIKKQNAAYKKTHKESIAIKNSQYCRDNPHIFKANTAKRRAAKLQRTVVWANLAAIKEVYSDCEEINLAAKLAGCTEIFHVDHIIPLQGKLVSGLHVENNLQIITAFENHSKNNRFIPG